ncbi:metallophosphoesterase [Ensifer sp. YR511]|uniref:metallophosphoesterase family protein n=1 Tax=Ensifer sp. YR511 TaxID=1855294 RepID=UPI00087DF722|nr:metallophosphoesterase [Ensifer sp. YR511]SDN71105.1 3',5'-cyclic AMP phosphodiesterase CpdA [Ensifer sp. YR511]
MSATFVHLSDIHFGQDVGKSSLYRHKDIKERLIEDVGGFFHDFPAGSATGVLLAGDLAYKGKRQEYEEAGDWLDRLTAAAGCKPHAVQIIPGNHDIDRDMASKGVDLILDHLATSQGELNDFLLHEIDRKLLFCRFGAYSEFAEAYDCSVDEAGGPVGVWRVPVGPGRTLKILGLNSAILCRQTNEKGELLLGPNQTVISPPRRGEFLAVMIHHPLDWIKDGEEAMKYIQNRANVLISGHEHSNRCGMDKQVLTIDAGAVIPPMSKGTPLKKAKFGYSYNIIEFASEGAEEVLSVTIHTRRWSDTEKKFVSAKELKRFELPARPSPQEYSLRGHKSETNLIGDEIAPILYDFFRKLKAPQRTSLLNMFGVLPAQRSTRNDRTALDEALRTEGATCICSMIEKLKRGEVVGNSGPRERHIPSQATGRSTRGRRRSKRKQSPTNELIDDASG